MGHATHEVERRLEEANLKVPGGHRQAHPSGAPNARCVFRDDNDEDHDDDDDNDDDDDDDDNVILSTPSPK